LIWPDCQGQLIRVPELVHPWFEDACMPFASWGYPWKNQSLFEQQFPADLVCVDSDEAKNWFPDIHTVNGILFTKASFKEKIQFNFKDDEPGKKNQVTTTDPINKALNEFGGDVLRWYLYDCQLDKDGKLASDNLLQEHSLRVNKKNNLPLLEMRINIFNQALWMIGLRWIS
jgi:isoleucyl-tRNA synthetase